MAVARLVARGTVSPESARKALDGGRCPSCGAAASRSAFHCGQCGLLGRGVSLEGRFPSRTSLVRALLSPAGHEESAPQPAALGEEARTRVYDAATAVRDTDVPCFTAGLEWASALLSPLEVQLASLVDGVSTVAEIAASAGISAVEGCVILRSLVARRLVSTSLVPMLDEEPRTIQAGSSMQLLAMTMGESRSTGPERSALHEVVSLERAGRDEEALTMLQQAIGGDAGLLNRLACVVLGIRHDAAAAERLFRRARELDPKNPVLEANLHAVTSITDRF